MREVSWVIQDTGCRTFRQLRLLLQECRRRLPWKLSGSSVVSNCHPEKFLITSPCSDQVKCMLTLLGDNIVQSEVTIKYTKAPGHVYKGTAQPDVQWKLQQLQDIANYIQLALTSLDKIEETFAYREKNNKPIPSGKVFSWLQNIMKFLHGAQFSLVLPKKRSINELKQTKALKCFLPPLPADLVVSYYISSYRLVCCVYHLGAAGGKGFVVYQAECCVMWLNEVLMHLNSAVHICQAFIHKIQVLMDIPPPISSQPLHPPTPGSIQSPPALLEIRPNWVAGHSISEPGQLPSDKDKQVSSTLQAPLSPGFSFNRDGSSRSQRAHHHPHLSRDNRRNRSFNVNQPGTNSIGSDETGSSVGQKQEGGDHESKPRSVTVAGGQQATVPRPDSMNVTSSPTSIPADSIRKNEISSVNERPQPVSVSNAVPAGSPDTSKMGVNKPKPTPPSRPPVPPAVGARKIVGETTPVSSGIVETTKSVSNSSTNATLTLRSDSASHTTIIPNSKPPPPTKNVLTPSGPPPSAGPPPIPARSPASMRKQPELNSKSPVVHM